MPDFVLLLFLSDVITVFIVRVLSLLLLIQRANSQSVAPTNLN
jgi:hypothetical protein